MLKNLKIQYSKTISLLVFLRFCIKYLRPRKSLIKDIKKRQHVNIAFIVSSLPMWKSQSIVEKFKTSSRFDVKIILAPNITEPIEHQQDSLRLLRAYFKEIGQEFIDYNIGGAQYDLKKEFSPDIIFYTQSYDGITYCGYDYHQFLGRLIAYIPYSFWPGAEPYGFDLSFHRCAWKIFYANELIYKYAKSVSLIRARNSIIVGYPSADLFLRPEYKDVWKIHDRKFKRVIWAPHFTIRSRDWNTHASFLEIADGMIKLANSYKDKLQIAFKPHPKLKSELYLVWGKERTDAYYRQWESMQNTQLECGEYVDLFMTSDCLIHDCGSFLVEYQYTLKPSLYILPNYSALRPTLNDLGKQAFDLHYKGENINEIEGFIKNVLINGQDSKISERQQFYKQQLLPPNSKTVAENVYSSICQSLGIEE